MRSTAPLFFITTMLLCRAGAVAERVPNSATTNPLSHVHSFMYQLQNLDAPASLDALAKSDYDMVVVEPTATLRDSAAFDMKGMVAKLHAGKKGRLVIAYLDACQAERFRAYWKTSWRAPTATNRGVPDFLLAPDSDGWTDDYSVAYWDPRWQEIFVTGDNSEVHQAMAAGFDGVYLDWLDAFDDDFISAQAKDARVDPAKEMVDFLFLIRKTARQVNPNAVVIQQNAFTLIDADPRVLDAIDGLGVEDTWFSGKANAKWGTKEAGDVPNKDKGSSSTAARLAHYRKFIMAGKPVFTIDYCLKPEHAAQVYADAHKAGLVPLVTQVSLDHLTTTPPAASSP